MQWSSSISREMEAADAVKECLAKLRKDLGDVQPDAVFVFVSPHHSDSYDLVLGQLSAALKPKHLLGCSGGGVIGNGREVEDMPGLSVTAAILPGVNIKSLSLDDDDLPSGDAAPGAWESMLGCKAEDKPQFLLLLSPFMGKAEELLAGLDYAFPKSPKVGGLVSGLRGIGERAMFLDGQRVSDGAAMLILEGNIQVDTLVAQGCRGIGGVYTITRCEGNILHEIDGKPALKLLTEIYESCDAMEKKLMNKALFVGLITDPLLPWPPKHGDFLIRSVMGIDVGQRNIAVGSELREGQALRFHVRDSEAAAEDLRSILEGYAKSEEGGTPLGALLFSCQGRGEGMYGEPDHDSQEFSKRFGPVPIGGFFCNGEIGQVGSSTYIHSFTSSFGLFRSKD